MMRISSKWLLARSSSSGCRRVQSFSTAAAAEASTSASFELPTRHSVRSAPRACRDAIELDERTKQVLKTPVGQLYSYTNHNDDSSASNSDDDRMTAYAQADSTIQLVEYLMRGHQKAAQTNNVGSVDPAESLIAQQALLHRMQQEGNTYMELRQQGKNQGYSDSSSSDSDSSSSSEEEDSDNSDSGSDSDSEKNDDTTTLDFAPPGPTANMYNIVLDGMACVNPPKVTPKDYFDLAATLLQAHHLDGSNIDRVETLPTMVTYNAPLRGIAKIHLKDEVIRDEALMSAFEIYNYLTHSVHLNRNASTFLYMLQILDHAIPDSRVKGNMSVTFWQQCSQIGVVHQDIVDCLLGMHQDARQGPEFQPLVDKISGGDLPQRYRRFVNKYQHSKYY